MKKKLCIAVGVLAIIMFIFGIIMFISKNNIKDRTLDMYKKMTQAQEYMLSMEVQDDDLKYKITIAQKGTDMSIDMYSSYDDNDEHTTTLIADGYTYFIMHNEEEYSVYDSAEIEADVLILEMKDVENKEYQTGKEEINGKEYYYEEYNDITRFLMLTNIDDEDSVKTRFYFNKDGIAYIKNIIEVDGETIEELIKTSVDYTVEDSLFEIPSDYAEL